MALTNPSLTGRPTCILIIDDHPLYSDALASALQMCFEGCAMHRASSMEETVAVLESGVAPDLIMLDLKLPDVNGISGFEKLRQRMPRARILVISSLASVELVQSLLDRGAMGFLPKESPASTLRHAVSEIASGRRYVPREYLARFGGQSARFDNGADVFQTSQVLASLTPQQTRILKLIRAGKPNKQIAYELSLAEATVKAHITALLRRLGVRNRTQAAVMVEELEAQQAGNEQEVRTFLRN
ncbi:LuxR family two component transcriptional regulator [Rhodovulum imhoffii]|uniref:LuxR family two component transcriptional regulator n=1 Tax=Rhodovulum imhoffii TaxID=365340 RepID=A0A2T5BWT6_9RHOB|nr:response regulator transcription factor [Rhodovulum imhoffii]MBK5933292.1 DNA-binding response regulator [Rhodovulum imhoffii]PTN04050.1 LuxR family two component transcriptional regulator [Rhodovulum imhoffii]